MADSVVDVGMLGRHPDLVAQIGEMRWREWGDGDASAEGWTQVTSRESRLDRLPVTLVAIDEAGVAVGAVALGLSDDALSDDERLSRSPWLLGLIVEHNHRRQGIGRRLVGALEDLARGHGHSFVWVATGPQAVDFYVRCGWAIEDELTLRKGGWHTFILKRFL